MRSFKEAKVISLAKHRSSSVPGELPGGDVHNVQERDFYYTLDLLMEDFGKKHVSDHCALCEPMKVMGKHRDEIMEEFALTLFTTFFPSFDEYVLEVQETLTEGLLRRDCQPESHSWKDKLKFLLKNQIKKDMESFLLDIGKHLEKYASVPLEEAHREKILGTTMKRLQEEWISA